jgi:hypothetical protein
LCGLRLGGRVGTRTAQPGRAGVIEETLLTGRASPAGEASEECALLEQ